MRSIFIFVMGLLFLSGCCQLTDGAFEEIGTCMEKCSELCDLAKENNFDFEGYSIGLSKKAGGVSVKCDCPCFGE